MKKIKTNPKVHERKPHLISIDKKETKKDLRITP